MSISNLFSPNDDTLYCAAIDSANTQLDIGMHSSSVHIANAVPDQVYINEIPFPQGFTTLVPAYGSLSNGSLSGNINIGPNSAITFDIGTGSSPHANMTIPAVGGSALGITYSGIYVYEIYVLGQALSPTPNTPITIGLSISGAPPLVDFEFNSNFTTAGASDYLCSAHGIVTLTAGQTVSLINRTYSGASSITLLQYHYGGSTESSTNAKLSLFKIG